MATREEIEKALARELRDLKHKSYDSLQAAQWILGILSSQGVVIKVDRELPDNPYKRKPRVEGYDLDYRQDLDIASFFTQRAMLEAGYVAVEPLIKEVKNDSVNRQDG